MKIKENPTLLSLLKAGCKIELPDGRYLKGDPDSQYIDIGNEFGKIGSWDLSRKGLDDIQKDRDFHA